MELCVVLVNPLYQGNVGAVARVMANFGLSQLFIVGDFVVEQEARNRAKHANHVLSNMKRFGSFSEARKHFDLVIGTSGVIGSDDNLLRSPLLVEEAVLKLKGFDGRVGLFFGSEDKGLSKDDLSLCDFVISIPCSDDYGVMNVSHAAAIVFYEFFKVFKDNKLREGHVLASVKEKDVAYEVILSILEDMSFRAESDRETQKVLWRKVLGKSFITKREISSLLGFFRNIHHSLKKKS